ncbi:MAG TPA: phenylalanine--tRNA ligase subunit beta [Alphaproteobacteria bacterium]|nr:phenylalanine--tRNA ligase subunit beta [Alphaproteobacteria bacterium]
MPTIKYNKKMLMELLGRRISDDVLAEKITYLGTALEEMGDNEITVEIFPNRPDLLSEHGMARALLAFMDIKPGFKKYDVKKSGVKVVVDKSVKTIRPYTACAVVKGLKLSDEKIREIIQIQEKLHGTYCRNRKKAAIGVYPLEHIKPPIYYKALHPEEIRFKPLDLNKDLTGSQILAIHPTGREYGHLLEGKDKYPVFLDSKQNVLSMPPIINSNNVGKITATTRDVFVECSGFEFDYVHTCLNMVVTALSDMGGSIYSVDVSYPDKKYVTPELSGKEIKFDPAYTAKILGFDLKEADIKKLLSRMGHEYKGKKVLVPNYRADILHPIDLVEDIAIAYGYQNIVGTTSNFSSRAQERPIESFKNKLRDILVGLGLIEVKNYHLTNKDAQSRLMNYNVEVAELENSVTQNYDVLRAWITPCLMETLKSNKHYDYPQNIFEVGTVFKLDSSMDIGVSENDRLAIGLCGNDANFTKIKQVLDVIMDALSLKYEITDTEHSSFIKGRTGRVLVNGAKIAYIGEIHPQVLSNWSIEMPVAVLELNLTELFRNLYNPKVYSEDLKDASLQEKKASKIEVGNKPKTEHKAKPAAKSKPKPKNGKKKK